MRSQIILFLIPMIIASAAACASHKSGEPPETAKGTVTTNFFGTAVSDPYRWLEDGRSPEVKKWIDEQNAYTDRVLSGFPEGKPLQERIEKLSTTSVQRSSPQLANGRLFFMQFTPPQPQPVVAYETWPNGEVKVLVDPNKSETGTAVTGFWPSPKGTYVAYGTATGGSEATTLRIMNVETGKSLTDSLPDAGGGETPAGVAWDADEKGLTYVRLPSPGTVPEADLKFYAALYHHELGRPAADDRLVFGKGLSKVAEYAFIPSDHAEHVAAFVHFGDGSPDTVYVREGNGDWRKVLGPEADVRVASETRAGAAWDGNRLLVISYENAPKGKVLSLGPGGKRAVVVPPGEWAMNSLSLVRGGFLLTRVNGPDWRIDQYDSRGRFIRTVDLPRSGIGFGSIASSGESDQALVTYSGWVIPDRWAEYDCRTGAITTVFEVTAAADYSKVEARKIEAISKDGTRIPLTLLTERGLTPNGRRPTIVTGYGGFDSPTAPRFIGPYLAWIENGGVLAYANIRGGGEFGEGWHEEGMLGKKQNVFDDMYAAAEAMVRAHWTDPDHLGILGGSNGGLLMGAELTQHPEAFRAVVSLVGIYDMLRHELFPNGQYNISEYGTATKEADFRWLYAYSPYHHVKPHTAYPATLLETGVNDPRVAPWQSRKFAAALQAANTSGRPILLLTRMNEGHGVTASFSQRVGNTAAALTFFAHELGLKIR